MFVYKDEDGNINKDIKCKKLAGLIEPIASAKAQEIFQDDCDIRQKRIRMPQLRRDIDERIKEIENLNSNLVGYKLGSIGWKDVSRRIEMYEKANDEDMAEFRRLERELGEIPRVFCVRNDEVVNIKLMDGVTDIKNMTKDATKFSRTLSEHI
jgi:hypothetical protein